jgi:hypothetical protein
MNICEKILECVRRWLRTAGGRDRVDISSHPTEPSDSGSQNRLLSKQRYFEEFIGAYGAQDRSVHVVHEDPSTEATQKLPKERMFRKKSIYTSLTNSVLAWDVGLLGVNCLCCVFF